MIDIFGELLVNKVNQLNDLSKEIDILSNLADRRLEAQRVYEGVVTDKETILFQNDTIIRFVKAPFKDIEIHIITPEDLMKGRLAYHEHTYDYIFFGNQPFYNNKDITAKVMMEFVMALINSMLKHYLCNITLQRIDHNLLSTLIDNKGRIDPMYKRPKESNDKTKLVVAGHTHLFTINILFKSPYVKVELEPLANKGIPKYHTFL